MLAAIPPIPGHAVFLLLVQLALLLLVARLGASAARGIGLPAVVGELAAGIVLGPTVFGHYAPGAFALVFPQEAAQFHLLETVGLLGMVLLLLLTGLETDLRLLKNLGRAAVVASVLGMVVPFALGFGLGLWMPDQYLAQPDRRVLFAAFLATAMAISAMPVIAKILMDLDLTRRNIGLVILSAGVVDDTAGWLVLSLIAGAATQGGGVKIGGFALTLLFLAVFIAAVAFVVYPLMRFALKLVATRLSSPDTDLVLIVAITFLCAAVTEHIGVHAVFGAFIVGTALRQVPHLDHRTVVRLESFVFSILAPVFFGIVGLKVDLWTLGGGGGAMLGIVVAIACIGKLVGVTAGGLWGGMSWWEAISIAVAMNARGAMELVVATIGLSLGILNQQTFSMIVVVAIFTSFLAPVLLRLTMRMVEMTRDERQRLLEEKSRGVFDPAHIRLLVPTAGGPNAIEAARISLRIAAKSENPTEVVYVEEVARPIDRLLRRFRKVQAGSNLEQHLAAIRALAPEGTAPPVIRRLAGSNAPHVIAEEAGKGFDAVVIGASGGAARLGGRVLEDVVEQAPCHVIIVKSGGPAQEFRKVFVPIDGSTASRVAAELALRYCEATGAALTLALIAERTRTGDTTTPALGQLRPSDTLRGAMAGEIHDAQQRLSELPELGPEEQLARISPAFRVSSVRPTLLYLAYHHTQAPAQEEIERGGYDLVVFGAENRAVRKGLFFGHENQRVLELGKVTTVIVVPKIGKLNI